NKPPQDIEPPDDTDPPDEDDPDDDEPEESQTIQSDSVSTPRTTGTSRSTMSTITYSTTGPVSSTSAPQACPMKTSLYALPDATDYFVFSAFSDPTSSFTIQSTASAPSTATSNATITSAPNCALRSPYTLANATDYFTFDTNQTFDDLSNSSGAIPKSKGTAHSGIGDFTGPTSTETTSTSSIKRVMFGLQDFVKHASTMTFEEEASSTVQSSTQAAAEAPDESPSSTSPPPGPPPPPATAKPAVCNPNVGNCDYKKPSPEKTSNLMDDLSETLGDDTSMNAMSPDIFVVNTDEDPRLLLNIGWIKDCDTYEEQNPAWPSEKGNADIVPTLIFSELAQTDCGLFCLIDLSRRLSLTIVVVFTGTDGREVGAFLDVGCLRYGFYPTRMDLPDDDDEVSFKE
ncbi:MAG: hypothetical protein Q9174_007329, partial [Haloplaca sp. 1 TL-2023]